ncbi:SWIM zinc finger family protein [Thermus brockianus]|uniref:SWIM-type domain-containing protein n=1 Tax=Thermus brockianus TaxID=56956 RepID=A0ABM7XN16_THEBO|nr:SWIM zinc finger family protein [Thermus brockianus]BDG17743.1 hypothetical protein TbrSNM41_24770 [Thermus brockianus]
MLAFLDKLKKAEALLKEEKLLPVMGCKDLFVVEGQEGKGHYLVDLGAETCTCPAWTQGKSRPCKHPLAAVLHLWREESPDIPRGRWGNGRSPRTSVVPGGQSPPGRFWEVA